MAANLYKSDESGLVQNGSISVFGVKRCFWVWEMCVAIGMF